MEEIIDKKHDVEAILTLIEKNPEMPASDEVFRIRDWLIKEYKGKLSDFQKIALDEAVFSRIRNFIDPEIFKNFLKKPKKDFGMGLSFRTAQFLSERMESLLLGIENHNEPGVKTI